MSQQLKGLLITALGVMVIVPDSLMIRLIDADAMPIIAWRSGLSALTMALICTGLGAWRMLGRMGLLFAVTEAAGTFLFIIALENTSVAATLFLVSTAPVFSAAISWLFLGEQPSRRTVWTIIGALIGIAVIASASFGSGGHSFVGDLAALGVAISLAIAFNAVRHSSDLPILPALTLAYVIAASLAVTLAPSLAVPREDWIWLGLNGAIFVPLGFMLMAIGPRYITAAEVALLLLLEAVLAPLLVWAVLGEDPGQWVLFGGAIVLGVLFFSNLAALMEKRRERARL